MWLDLEEGILESFAAAQELNQRPGDHGFEGRVGSYYDREPSMGAAWLRARGESAFYDHGDDLRKASVQFTLRNRASQKRYRAKHRDELNARQRAKRAEKRAKGLPSRTPEQLAHSREYQRLYRASLKEKNPEVYQRCLRQKSEWGKANRERILARRQERRTLGLEPKRIKTPEQKARHNELNRLRRAGKKSVT